MKKMFRRQMLSFFVILGILLSTTETLCYDGFFVAFAENVGCEEGIKVMDFDDNEGYGWNENEGYEDKDYEDVNYEDENYEDEDENYEDEDYEDEDYEDEDYEDEDYEDEDYEDEGYEDEYYEDENYEDEDYEDEGYKHLVEYWEEDYDWIDEPHEDERDVGLKLIYPKNGGTVPAGEPLTIRWSQSEETESWHVEIFRNRVGLTYERVYGNPKLTPIEAEWMTPSAEFIVIIEPVQNDGNGNVYPKRFSFMVEKSSSRSDEFEGSDSGEDDSKHGSRKESSKSVAGKGEHRFIAPSWNTKNTLKGLWKMTEVRKDRSDVIQFNVNIVTIDDDGCVALDWGDSGRIKGTWDESHQTLHVHGNQIYVLHDGVLGGANERYSGVALRADERQTFFTEQVLGAWQMTEYRKDVNNDIIQFDVNILSIDENGNATIDWGDSACITGKWDSLNNTLTVFNQQVYIFQDGMFGGGSEKYSGIALRKAY